jgi:signal transduction histidine kinase
MGDAMEPQVPREDSRRPHGTTLDLERESDRGVHFEVIGELIASVAHDLRQPLTAMGMNLSAAIHFLRRARPDVREAIAAIEDASGQQRRMRDALLVLEELASRREPRRERCDLASIVRDAVSLVQVDASVRHVPIVIDVESPSTAVSGDRMLIREALLNILSHALETASLETEEPKAVRITVRCVNEKCQLAIAFAEPRVYPKGRDAWSLALARSVASVHGASLTLEPSSDGTRIVTTWQVYEE